MTDLRIRLALLNLRRAFVEENRLVDLALAAVKLTEQDECLSIKRINLNDLAENTRFLVARALRDRHARLHLQNVLALSFAELRAVGGFDRTQQAFRLDRSTASNHDLRGANRSLSRTTRGLRERTLVARHRVVVETLVDIDVAKHVEAVDRCLAKTIDHFVILRSFHRLTKSDIGIRLQEPKISGIGSLCDQVARERNRVRKSLLLEETLRKPKFPVTRRRIKKNRHAIGTLRCNRIVVR